MAKTKKFLAIISEALPYFPRLTRNHFKFQRVAFFRIYHFQQAITSWLFMGHQKKIKLILLDLSHTMESKQFSASKREPNLIIYILDSPSPAARDSTARINQIRWSSKQQSFLLTSLLKRYSYENLNYNKIPEIQLLIYPPPPPPPPISNQPQPQFDINLQRFPTDYIPQPQQQQMNYLSQQQPPTGYQQIPQQQLLQQQMPQQQMPPPQYQYLPQQPQQQVVYVQQQPYAQQTSYYNQQQQKSGMGTGTAMMMGAVGTMAAISTVNMMTNHHHERHHHHHHH